MKNLKLIIKGFFIGIANIIPGVSGGTLMITLGIFDELIGAISHFLENFKKNIKFLSLIAVGALLSIVLMSRVVTFGLENYRLPTILFFIGLIIGGVPMLYSKVKNTKKRFANIALFIIPFALLMIMTFAEGGLSPVNFNDMNIFSYILLFLVGIVAAATMVVPGLSGSFMLILLGYYEPILGAIKEFTSFDNIISNGIVLSVFGIGVLIGIVLVAKLIEFLLKKYEIKTYFVILGFVFGSIISIYITAYGDGLSFSFMHIALGIVLAITGFMISYKLGD